MATRAKFDISVTSSRGASHVTATSKGRYVSFQTNGIVLDMPRQPIYTTASLKAFWLAVLADVTTAVNALP
jgi:hypothetical protein